VNLDGTEESSQSAQETIAKISRAAAVLRQVIPGESSESSRRERTNPGVSLSNLNAAFGEVVRIQESVARAESDLSPDVVISLAEYRRLLRIFKANLARIYGWLLTERARLVSRSSHSSAVENWARTNRQTRQMSGAQVGRSVRHQVGHLL
jgi:hypothetical protein